MTEEDKMAEEFQGKGVARNDGGNEGRREMGREGEELKSHLAGGLSKDIKGRFTPLSPLRQHPQVKEPQAAIGPSFELARERGRCCPFLFLISSLSEPRPESFILHHHRHHFHFNHFLFSCDMRSKAKYYILKF